MTNVETYAQNKKRKVENFCSNFLNGPFTYQTQNPEQDDTSAVAPPATFNAPVVSTVFEIPRWSDECYGLMMATLLYSQRAHRI